VILGNAHLHIIAAGTTEELAPHASRRRGIVLLRLLASLAPLILGRRLACAELRAQRV
jgi:hypothetical protein